MVVGCGPTCLKYTFFTFNFLVFLCGGAILGLAVWARFDNSLEDAINKKYAEQGEAQAEMKTIHVALYVIMGIGGMLILCGGLGCLGACCENPCLLGTFFAIILTLFLAEIAAAIYIFVRKDEIKADVSKWYKEQFVDKYDADPSIKAMLDKTQETWKCCGANGCKDYTYRHLRSAPESCGCGSLLFDGSTEGCVDKVYKNLTIVAIIAICLVVIELLAMIFSCILCSSIRRYSY